MAKKLFPRQSLFFFGVYGDKGRTIHSKVGNKFRTSAATQETYPSLGDPLANM